MRRVETLGGAVASREPLKQRATRVGFRGVVEEGGTLGFDALEN
jgi:hypothetical protein